MSILNVIATIRHLDFGGEYDANNQPIHVERFEHRIWLEGFATPEDAEHAAAGAVRNNPGVVVAAWIQPAGELPDPTKGEVQKAQREAWRRYRQFSIDRDAYEFSDADPGL